MNLIPQHPGHELAKMLEEKKCTIAQFSRRIGVSSSRISQILSEKRRITTDSAFRLSDALNTTPDFWLDRQKEYDIFIKSLSYTGE